MHDDTQVARVFEMGKMLRVGMFPVRWVPDLGYGYGYPIFNFYGPLAYYVGGLFVVLGFDALIATKIMMITGILFAGVTMYFLAKEFWGEAGGVLSGAFYMYAPYHALDIYVRGDVGEFWAYAFIPLAFLGLYKVYKNNSWKWTMVGAIGYAGVIVSHNLTAMMVTPFLLAFFVILVAFSKKKLQSAHFLAHIFFLGLILSAFYWLPALSEMSKTNVLSQVGGGANFRDHFVCVQQLWDSPWGFGGSAPGCVNDGLSFRIGKQHIIFALVSVILAAFWFGKNKKNKKSLLPFVFSITGAIVAVLFTLEYSKPVWEMISTMAFFQYPWRFLLMVVFFLSFAIGGVAFYIKAFIREEKYILAVCLGVIIALISINLKLFAPKTIDNKTASDYISSYQLKWVTSKISDEYLPKNFKKPKDASAVFAGSPSAPSQTSIEIISNWASIAGIFILILGIIRTTALHEKIKR